MRLWYSALGVLALCLPNVALRREGAADEDFLKVKPAIGEAIQN